MKKEDGPVVVEQSFNTSIDIVWKAITEIDLMRQWYFENIPDFRPEVGFGTQFNVTSQDRNFLHIWTVTEVAPPNRIAYDWRYKEYAGDASVLFELKKSGDRTQLRLTMNVREDFPEDIPEFTRESCLGGWDYFIRHRLKSFLESD